MIAVILAGGGGTRLWPLSTSKRPKHTLELLGGRSLLNITYERAKDVTDDIYILTDHSHDRSFDVLVYMHCRL